MKSITAIALAGVLAVVVAYAVVSVQTNGVLAKLNESALEREDLESLLADCTEIKHVKALIKILPDHQQIEVTCDRNFNVVSVYADIDSPELGLKTEYRSIKAVGDFAGDGRSSNWEITSKGFYPHTGWFSYELLSGLAVPTPIGIPAAGRLAIDFTIQTDTPDNDTLRAAAIVETAHGASCSISATEGS